VKRRERRKFAHVLVSEAALLGFRIEFVKRGPNELFVCSVCLAHWKASSREIECPECKGWRRDLLRAQTGVPHRLLSDRKYENKKDLLRLGIEVKGL
jgi:hypothetical protein